MRAIQDVIRDLDLKTMDPALLTLAIREEAQVIGIDPSMVDLALMVAAYGHRDQTRANRGNLPRDNYITHPLRNALRLIRYGVSDQDIIVAAILHDVVEDCSAEIARRILKSPDGTDSKTVTLGYLRSTFGDEVAHLVSMVTNKPMPSDATKDVKRRLYAKHVESVVWDPKVFLVKFTDFVDNAVGLTHNNTDPKNAGMVQHLATKYLPLVQIFEDNLSDEVLEFLTADGEKQLREHLRQGLLRLAHLKAGPAHV